MRLKHLNLHGFKTFAPKTELEFGEGLTAIVGPNGSGKSNIADAVRWVLGEQSFSNLRAKRTEDLIFAGSSNRAPLGMAEVSITIDNVDRLLPLEFSEVTLTRRAYRSGENEYYINKSRVRLRDVLDVASTLGQAYTVVGQGLVDAALSLRPEERRELFEEAAAIRGYFVQREDALKRLARTEENVARVSDLVSELEPQVKRMERQARQAQEYKKLEGELHALLAVWYRSRWALAVESLGRAQRAEQLAASDVEVRKLQLSEKSAQLNEARARVWQLVDDVSSLHEQRAQEQARHAAQSQAQAVLGERLSSARLRKQSLEKEKDVSRSSSKKLAAQLAQLGAEIASHAQEVERLEGTEREVRRLLAAVDARIEEAQAIADRDNSQLQNLLNRGKDFETQAAETERSRAGQERAAEEAQTALGLLSERAKSEEKRLEELHQALTDAQRAVAEAEQERSAVQRALAAARAAQSSAEAEHREALRRSDSVASQLAGLAAEQQAGLYGGVRAVVSAAADGKLSGYIGTVAELFRVPADLETAIEAALGGRLQDVVVRTWADAEQAIGMLKALGAGRATFLPLDTVRASGSPAVPKDSGIMGVACDLVQYEPYLKTLAESLLGRLLIVQDLASARRVLATLQPNAPWTLATLGGEVVRPGGSVTGGAHSRRDDPGARGKTILARERRRRELAAALEGARRETTEKERSVETSHLEVSRQEDALASASNHVEEMRKRQAGAQLVHLEQQSAVARLHQEISWRNGLLSEARKNIEHHSKRLSQIASQREETAALLAPQRALVEEQSHTLEDLRNERARVAGGMGEGQTRLAVLAETLRNLRRRESEVVREASQLEAKTLGIEVQLEETANEETLLTKQLEEQAANVARLAEQVEAIERDIARSEREARLAEGEVSTAEGEQSGLQAALLESETAFSRAAVERQRCIGVLDSLRVEIAEELGSGSEDRRAAEDGLASLRAANRSGGEITLADLRWPGDDGEGEQDRKPGPEGVQLATLSPEQHGEQERRIYAMKSRLSRIGPVNPLAMEEHAELSARHDYLQAQLRDLLSAAESLRRVIAELDRTMRDQFAATFELVNQAFQHFFHTLFGGGTARLELTNPHDVPASGIEILAQPPGKRMQPLAALSGGERALTSAALLFALLRVRPVPFCVLDEVDAALDESNVTRFRSALQELGQKTQFVVITHNRGTIEAADTLYGISMAGDGTSQMLSLKVEAA